MLKKIIHVLLASSVLLSLSACGESLPLAESLISANNSELDLNKMVDGFTALSPDQQQDLAQSMGDNELQTLMNKVQDLEPQERQTQVYQQLNQSPKMVRSLQNSSVAGYQADTYSPFQSEQSYQQKPRNHSNRLNDNSWQRRQAFSPERHKREH